MSPSHRLLRFFCAALFAVSLATCGHNQQIFPANALRNEAATGSWVSPEASKEDLLYVTEDTTVSIFTYPQGKLVGELKGFSSPSGACSDMDGNVFITDYKPVAIFEYAHGNSKRIATYKLKYVGPLGCAVDAKTGDLAATGSSQKVEIFRKHRSPLVLTIPNMQFDTYCTYDNDGNLYIEGTKYGGDSLVSKLPFGSRRFSEITFNAPLDTWSNVQWDGKRVLFLSYGRHKKVAPRILQFTVSGAKGTKVGYVPLGEPAYQVVEYAVAKGSLVLSNWRKYGIDSVLIYNYPNGGAPRKQITKDQTAPRGVAVSSARGQVLSKPWYIATQ